MAWKGNRDTEMGGRTGCGHRANPEGSGGGGGGERSTLTLGPQPG